MLSKGKEDMAGASPCRKKLEKNQPPEHHYGFSEGQT